MRAAGLFLLFAGAAWACKCQVTMSPCNEATATDIIFIGTVESIEPSFLDSWSPTQRASLAMLNEEYARVQNDRSAVSFAKLREAYLKIFPDLPAEHKKRLAQAASTADLAELFYWILDHGKRVRFRVKTVFRGEAVEKEAGKTVDIWTPFGDCGVAFQNGETYLVYADDDEESDVMSTGACTRTRRLSDAGDDLAYLYFFKNNGDHAGRVEGFVTTDLLYQRQLDLTQYSDRIDGPVAGALVELSSSDGPRYSATDSRGHFVFDGLGPGSYVLKAFTSEFPVNTRLLAGPREIRLERRACASQVLVEVPEPPR